MTRFTVATFARFAEVLGSDKLEVELQEPARVADLIAALRAMPGGERLPTQPMVAVNLQQADPETPLTANDSLALLPPLAGG
jgi:molybdopterin synthase sulfur carrier subunit